MNIVINFLRYYFPYFVQRQKKIYNVFLENNYNVSC